ncbi:unnamed protein product, partial [Mesorhabditis belari]|uniref:Uncharacterized protein n=1 Tax=Mesorhabditis belari TaxID=2138241 RepID=A0AAF3EH96_9BILA
MLASSMFAEWAKQNAATFGDLHRLGSLQQRSDSAAAAALLPFVAFGPSVPFRKPTIIQREDSKVAGTF